MNELAYQFEKMKQWNNNRALSEKYGYDLFNKYRALFHNAPCDQCGGTGRWKDDELDPVINCPKCSSR